MFQDSDAILSGAPVLHLHSNKSSPHQPGAQTRQGLHRKL